MTDGGKGVNPRIGTDHSVAPDDGVGQQFNAIAELLHPDFTGLDPAKRSKKLVEGLLEGYGETPEELHAAFMHWVETRMPKK